MNVTGVLFCCVGLAVFVAGVYVLAFAFCRSAAQGDAHLNEIDEEQQQRG